MDYERFERRLLKLVFQTNLPLSPVHVAYQLQVPVAIARDYLEQMVENGILELDSDRDGHLLYRCPMRPALDTLPAPKAPRKKSRTGAPSQRPGTPHEHWKPQDLVSVSNLPQSMTPNTEQGWPMHNRGTYSPAAAAALSLFLPGSGQMYSGRIAQGVGWLFVTSLGYLMFLLPGLVLHVLCVMNAAAVPSPRSAG